MSDIAGREHWDTEWLRPRPQLRFGATRPDRELSRFIRKHLRPIKGQRLIEIGAGNSRYLPGLATEFGYRVAGLDYSPVGAELALASLHREGVEGDVVVANLFEPPGRLLGQFDVVFTMGVVEHFAETSDALLACSRYMAPDGAMLTVIPNMHGFPGRATRWLSPELFSKHVAMSPRELAEAHVRAGLVVSHSGYLVGFDAWVANPGASPSRLKRALYKPLLALTRLVWLLEDHVTPIRGNRATSAWVVAVSRRKSGSAR